MKILMLSVVTAVGMLVSAVGNAQAPAGSTGQPRIADERVTIVASASAS